MPVESLGSQTPEGSPGKVLQALLDDLSFWGDPADKTDEMSKQSTEQSVSEPVPKPQRWMSAKDPVTGRVYYYDKVTRATQWEKPAEIRAYEKYQRHEQRRARQAFFAIMEENIRTSLTRGELIPGIPRTLAPAGPPQEPEEVAEDPVLPKPPRVRTISAMDEGVLAQLKDGSTPATAVARTLPPTNVPMEGRPPLPRRRAVSSKDVILEGELEEPKPETLHGEDLVDASLSKPNHVRRHTGIAPNPKSTMDNPNIDATIQCVCGVYRTHIQTAPQGSPVTVPHFDLDVFRDGTADPKVPTLEELTRFYKEFYRRSQMEHDTIIMSLIYVERLIKETHGALRPKPDNWRSLLCSCMILASKVWDDLSMWNVDFSNVSAASGLDQFSLQRINELEVAVLTCLNFVVRVPASEYAKYYFLIRTMLSRSGMLE